MNYKLLVTDLDGTLLTSQCLVSPRVQRAVAEAKRRGKYITFATGRNYMSSLPMLETLGLNAPLILYNGARIETHGPRKTLYAQDLPLECAIRALKLQPEFQIHVSLYLHDDIYVNVMNAETLTLMEKEHIVCHPVGDLVRFLGGRDPIKLLCIGHPDALAGYAAAYRALDGHSELVQSESNYLEVLPSGVSKGQALRFLADYLGLAVDEVIAVGDNLNDIEMLREAGLGVAMGNAHPDVKRVADRMTASNDQDGVAQVIEEYLLS